jgi:hypothetical protein
MSYVVFKTVVTNRPQEVSQALKEALGSSGCTEKPSRQEILTNSKFYQIRRLGELDFKCKSNSADLLVYKLVLPKNEEAAKDLALRTATLITENNDLQITPLILLSPDKDWKAADIQTLSKGGYDIVLESYFKQLRILGVSDESNVKWVILPNANLPYWDNSYIAPIDFMSIYNRMGKIMFSVYKKPDIGIILNSQTYETTPFSWTAREYLSFNQYISGVTKSYISFVGVEGLPWMPSLKVKDETMFTPKDYLNLKSLLEMKQALGVNEIYIVTGTFSTAYTQDPAQTTTVPAEIRKVILENTLREVANVKVTNVNITIVMLAQDLSSKEEQIDWSYWGSASTENQAHEVLLLDILRDAKNKNIKFGFYF